MKRQFYTILIIRIYLYAPDCLVPDASADKFENHHKTVTAVNKPADPVVFLFAAAEFIFRKSFKAGVSSGAVVIGRSRR
jgi:hypothetical protein